MRRTSESGATTKVLAGVAVGLVGRAGLRRLLLAKLRRDVARLNDGDAGPFLSGFADDAVLHFAPGEHRWAGEHRGKPAIERFMRDFTDAGLQGEIRDLWFGGPLRAMTIVVRFDDHAEAPDGQTTYANRTAIVVRTRWGKIVEQQDFYEDTVRMVAFDRRLQELGITRQPS